MDLKQLEKGDKVYVDGYTSFCDPYTGEVSETTFRYDQLTGEKYKVIIIDGHMFDSRDGSAMNPPTMYYLSDEDI
jgi:hypothetical protein